MPSSVCGSWRVKAEHRIRQRKMTELADVLDRLKAIDLDSEVCLSELTGGNEVMQNSMKLVSKEH